MSTPLPTISILAAKSSSPNDVSKFSSDSLHHTQTSSSSFLGNLPSSKTFDALNHSTINASIEHNPLKITFLQKLPNSSISHLTANSQSGKRQSLELNNGLNVKSSLLKDCSVALTPLLLTSKDTLFAKPSNSCSKQIDINDKTLSLIERSLGIEKSESLSINQLLPPTSCIRSAGTLKQECSSQKDFMSNSLKQKMGIVSDFDLNIKKNKITEVSETSSLDNNGSQVTDSLSKLNAVSSNLKPTNISNFDELSKKLLKLSDQSKRVGILSKSFQNIDNRPKTFIHLADKFLDNNLSTSMKKLVKSKTMNEKPSYVEGYRLTPQQGPKFVFRKFSGDSFVAVDKQQDKLRQLIVPYPATIKNTAIENKLVNSYSTPQLKLGINNGTQIVNPEKETKETKKLVNPENKHRINDKMKITLPSELQLQYKKLKNAKSLAILTNGVLKENSKSLHYKNAEAIQQIENNFDNSLNVKESGKIDLITNSSECDVTMNSSKSSQTQKPLTSFSLSADSQSTANSALLKLQKKTPLSSNINRISLDKESIHINNNSLNSTKISFQSDNNHYNKRDEKKKLKKRDIEANSEPKQKFKKKKSNYQEGSEDMVQRKRCMKRVNNENSAPKSSSFKENILINPCKEQFKSTLENEMKKLKRIKREDLETLILEVFIEKVLYAHELGNQRELCKRLESTLDLNKKKVAQFYRELEDLKTVTEKLQDEHISRRSHCFIPAKPKRSVGIQVTPNIISSAIMHSFWDNHSKENVMSKNNSACSSDRISSTCKPDDPKYCQKKFSNQLPTSPSLVASIAPAQSSQPYLLSNAIQNDSTATLDENSLLGGKSFLPSQDAERVINVKALTDFEVKCSKNKSSTEVIDLTSNAGLLVSPALALPNNSLATVSTSTQTSQTFPMADVCRPINTHQMNQKVSIFNVLPNDSSPAPVPSPAPALPVINNKASSNEITTLTSIVPATAQNYNSEEQNKKNNWNIFHAAKYINPPRDSKRGHPAPVPNYCPRINSSSSKAPLSSPELKLSIKSTGIVLSWNMPREDNNEDVCSYELYAYQEGKEPPTSSLWKRVGSVKALQLPMACTLTQFLPGHVYHFTIRAIDTKKRVGPFAEPKCINL